MALQKQQDMTKRRFAHKITEKQIRMVKRKKLLIFNKSVKKSKKTKI